MTRRPRGLAASAVLLSALVGCTPDAPPTNPDQANADSVGPTAPAGPPATVLLPVANEATISYRVWFQVGSQDDPPGKEGLAWMTAELIASGATENHSYEAITEALYPMAAGYGVRVDREMTTLTGRVHRDHREAFEGLFTDAYLQPKFAEADLERLRAQALSGVQKSLRYAQDEELGKASFFHFVFEGTGYAHPSGGTVEGLKSITVDDVKAFYTRHYTQNRTLFALGGGYEQATVDAIEATRAALPPTPDDFVPAAAPTPAAIEGRRLLLVDKPGADASISFGFPLDVHRGSKEFYALWLAVSWLGEHRNSSSHLYQVIREKRGLNYGDYAYIEAFPGGGWRQMPPSGVGRRQQAFEVWIRTLPNKHAHFALRAAVREIDTLVEKGMSKEDFELTRDFLTKYALHFADTTSARLGYAVDDVFYGVDGNHLNRFREMMQAITLDDVNAAVRKHLQTANMKIAISTGEAAKMKDAIVNDAPSPMEYASEKPKEVLDEDAIISTYPLAIPADNVTIVPVDTMFEKGSR